MPLETKPGRASHATLRRVVVLTGIILLSACATPGKAPPPAPAPAPAPIGVSLVPECIRQVRPRFPKSAIEKLTRENKRLRDGSIGGEVLVEFIVTTEGKVVNVYVVQSDDPMLDAAAVEAVEQWDFLPGMKNSRPVNTRMRVPIYFTLTPAPPEKAGTPGKTSK